MKTGFTLWELTHGEFHASYTGFGFEAQFSSEYIKKGYRTCAIISRGLYFFLNLAC